MTTSDVTTSNLTGSNVPPSNVTGGPVVTLPTAFGPFTTQAWTDEVTGVEHLSLSAVGNGQANQNGTVPLVRLHSECLTGDVFSSFRCDCGEQLEQALQLITEQGGTVLYLRGQEGRGIGLANKIRAYALQDTGADTIEANEQLGLPVDSRDYQAAAAILHQLGLQSIRLLSNNPEKRDKLQLHGIEVTAMVPSEVPARAENQRYLQTKRDRLNHRLTLLEDHGLQQS
ncbi:MULTISPECIES: GTP cyclohydrolase II [unclassified Arthrobacter]|uniref:GTP cyclohydrolase II n=1 Tax=unclassified Arthrobacter TaxID=235627 RepID=UPI00149262AE|nr:MULTISPECIES: GTP cyclohydrolase II [unclassified Arthrobacter]MBE0010947.1 GTP cyclohydrolase II [Arthrobacter sp. AET 35A]NOJ64453.1 GTP cyclohydrolase II [Arthrobacter sp. 147(2020)]